MMGTRYKKKPAIETILGHLFFDLAKKYSFTSFIILSTTQSTSWSKTNEYIIKEGDNLSEIVSKLVPGRLYGKNGSLRKVIQLNVNLKNPNLIVPGLVIILPGGSDPTTKGVDELPKMNELSLIPDKRVTSSPPPDFFRGGGMTIIPFYKMTQLKLTDSSSADASLNSKLHIGLDSYYSQYWTSTFESFALLSLGMASFQLPAGGLRKLSDDSQFLPGIGAGARYNISSRLLFSFTAKIQNELFGRGVSATEVEVDSLPIPSANIGLSYDLIALDPFILGMSGRLMAYMPSDADTYKVESGQGFGGSIFVKQAVGSGFQTELSYFSRKQNSSDVVQVEQNICLSLRFFFPVGRKELKGEL